jgi:hypothetical protein
MTKVYFMRIALTKGHGGSSILFVEGVIVR